MPTNIFLVIAVLSFPRRDHLDRNKPDFYDILELKYRLFFVSMLHNELVTTAYFLFLFAPRYIYRQLMGDHLLST